MKEYLNAALPDTGSWRAWLCPRSWPIRRSRPVCSATLERGNFRSCPSRWSSSQPPWQRGVRGTTCEQKPNRARQLIQNTNMRLQSASQGFYVTRPCVRQRVARWPRVNVVYYTRHPQQPGHRQGATLFASDWRVTLHHRSRTPSPISRDFLLRQ